MPGARSTWRSFVGFTVYIGFRASYSGLGRRRVDQTESVTSLLLVRLLFMSYNLTLTYALVTKSTEIASNAPSWGIAVMRLQHGRPKDSGFGALDLWVLGFGGQRIAAVRSSGL